MTKGLFLGKPRKWLISESINFFLRGFFLCFLGRKRIFWKNRKPQKVIQILMKMKKNSLRGYLLKGAHLCGLAKGAKRAPSKSVVLYGHRRVKKELGVTPQKTVCRVVRRKKHVYDETVHWHRRTPSASGRDDGSDKKPLRSRGSSPISGGSGRWVSGSLKTENPHQEMDPGGFGKGIWSIDFFRERDEKEMMSTTG
jgi:hypothetical protein